MDSKQYRWGVGGIDSDLGIFYFIKYVELYATYASRRSKSQVFFSQKMASPRLATRFRLATFRPPPSAILFLHVCHPKTTGRHMSA